MPMQPLFHDRYEAGRKLAAVLGSLRMRDPLVLALPRGGVPVAYEIARALDADLDLLFVRKLGAPGQEELGIGAIVDGAEPQIVLNDEIVRYVAASPDYIRAETERQLREIDRRRDAYLLGRAPLPMNGRTVLVVDDGIATGGTMMAALKGARKNQVARLILAIPVAPREALRELATACDEIICLATPAPFGSVGMYYTDFAQTTDAEVVDLLSRAAIARRRAGPVTGNPE
jgi:putative phosphoribosyl transferase